MTPSDSPQLATPPTAAYTLGAELERDRLERRVRRMTAVLGVLRQRQGEKRHEPGAAQRHRNRAIADFEAQIGAMNTRLRDLGTDGPSIQTLRGGDGHG